MAPPGRAPGREAAAHVVAAIAANFWLDGQATLSDTAVEYFASKTDPLQPDPDQYFLFLIDQMRGKPVSVPIFARLVQEKGRIAHLGFAWEDENVAPPRAITFRTALDRQCFTLNLPLNWAAMVEAPLELPEEITLGDRMELRLNIVGLPSEAYGTTIPADAGQAFGIRCRSHSVVTVEPIAAAVLSVHGDFITTVDPAYF